MILGTVTAAEVVVHFHAPQSNPCSPIVCCNDSAPAVYICKSRQSIAPVSYQGLISAMQFSLAHCQDVLLTHALVVLLDALTAAVLLSDHAWC